MNQVLNIFVCMLHKDLKRELRSKEIFISSFLLSIILICIFYFASTTSGVAYEKLSATALWICIIFSGTIGLNRTHQSELANGCYRGLMMAPVEGGWLYLAKVLTNLILLVTMLVLLLPLLAIFFNLDLTENIWWLIASLVTGVCAFTAVGTLVVAITGNTRMKDVLFPMIQLPLVVPILIAGVNSTQKAIQGEAPTTWIQFLLALNLVFLPLGFLLYEFLLEE